MDCFKNTGEIITTTRYIAPFTDIYIEDNIEVVLVEDTEQYLELKAGENLQSNILTEVRDNGLYISNINKCNWVRSYRKQIVLTIHTPDVLNIFHDGYSNLRTEGEFKVDTLFLHVTGAGDSELNLKSNWIWMDMYEFGNVSFTGSTQTLICEVAGFGKLISPDFSIQTAYLHISDGGDATVRVTDSLYAALTSLGNLYYYGQPETLVIEENGSGKSFAQE